MSAVHIDRNQNPAPRVGDYFGDTVKFSYDGSTMVCTALSFDAGINWNEPTVSVYTLSGEDFIYHSDLPIPVNVDLTLHPATHVVISPDGETILVNLGGRSVTYPPSTDYPGGATVYGGIWVYHLIDNVWTLVNTLSRLTTPTSGSPVAYKMGFQFDLSDNFTRMVISAPFDCYSSASSFEGSVDIWETTDNWLTYVKPPSLEGILYNAPTFLPQSFRGYNCAISGDGLTCFMSYYSTADVQSNIEFFAKDLNSGNWIFKQKIFTSDATKGTKFGQPEADPMDEFCGAGIATNYGGTVLIVGDQTTDSAKGSVYIFKRLIGDVFTQIYSEINTQAIATMGYSVAINDSGTVAIVGAKAEDSGSTTNVGYIYIYGIDGATAQFMQKIVAPTEIFNAFGGYKLTISGDGRYIASGSVGEPVGSVNLAGSINVWRYHKDPLTRAASYVLLDGTAIVQSYPL